MRVSSLEMLAAQNYYIPLNTFLSAIRIKFKQNPLPYSTQVMILVNQVEKEGNGLKGLDEFEEETGFDFFETRIRRSEKIQNTIEYMGIETVFTTNSTPSMLIGYFSLANEIFDSIQESLNVNNT